MAIYGAELTAWRERNNLSLEEAGKALGVDPNVIYNLERNITPPSEPNHMLFERLIRALDGNPGAILDAIYDLHISPQFLKDWRKRMGWDQDQAAKALGVGKSTLAKHEIARDVPRTLILACIGVESLYKQGRYKKDISN